MFGFSDLELRVCVCVFVGVGVCAWVFFPYFIFDVFFGPVQIFKACVWVSFCHFAPSACSLVLEGHLCMGVGTWP